MNLEYLQYFFDGKEHELNFNKMHGNAKGATDWRQKSFQ